MPAELPRGDPVFRSTSGRPGHYVDPAFFGRHRHADGVEPNDDEAAGHQGFDGRSNNARTDPMTAWDYWGGVVGLGPRMGTAGMAHMGFPVYYQWWCGRGERHRLLQLHDT
ncbi:hypothetical protein NGB58_26350, partial [Escherichia coli]|nr:hypothetical protein [Escherichia coli]